MGRRIGAAGSEREAGLAGNVVEERLARGNDPQIDRHGHGSAGVGELEDADFSGVVSCRQRTGVDADPDGQRREAAAGARWREAQPVSAFACRRIRTKANDRVVGSRDRQDLRQRIRPAERHDEADGIHLGKDSFAHRDCDRNGDDAASRLEQQLTVEGPSEDASSGQIEDVDRNGERFWSRPQGRSRSQPSASIRGAGCNGPVQCAATAVSDLDRLRRRCLARCDREAQPAGEVVEECARRGNGQSHRDGHRSTGIGELGDDDFSCIGSRCKRTRVHFRCNSQRSETATITRRRDAEPGATLCGYRARTKANRGIVGHGDVEYLWQRIRAAERHGEANRVHLVEHGSSHRDRDRNGGCVTCRLENQLTGEGSGERPAAREICGRDRDSSDRSSSATGRRCC